MHLLQRFFTVENNWHSIFARMLGLHQINKEPTHTLDASSSCIDLFFTSEPNLLIASRVHASLNANCHHQIISAKFNLQIYYYPPPYGIDEWHYKHANTDHIRKVI